MITVSRIGTTEENNQWVLPEGVMTMDETLNQVRVHDGQTPGGWAVTMTQVIEMIYGLGGQEIVAGDETRGYLGSLTAEEFLTTTQLSSEVGFRDGAIWTEEPTWHKFICDGKILLFPQEPLRKSVSWQGLYENGLVYGDDTDGLYRPQGVSPVLQNKRVTVQGFTYRVRLINNSYGLPDIGDKTVAEWQTLFLKLTDWANLSLSQLYQTDSQATNLTIPIQVADSDAKNTPSMWKGAVTWSIPINRKSTGDVWRPVLELVQ